VIVKVAICAATLGVVTLIAGCTAPNGDGPTSDGRIGPGSGSFIFYGAEEIVGKPIRVWYDAPPADLDTAQILIVMHGHERDAQAYRDDWVPLTRGRHVLLLVPEFAADDFSDTAYNLGNMVDSDGEDNPENRWTFGVIERLYDQVRDSVGSQAEEYMMFGHSAGAQFVHRFLQFGHPTHLGTAVAANAGWYTMPDDSEDFPYGLDQTARDEDDMGKAFETNLVLLLGADDVDPGAKSLRRSESADEQGDTRLERGLRFYLAGRESARDHDLTFGWRLEAVPGIGHSHSEMAREAAGVLLPPRP
jgi:hypothetical protein